MKRRTRKPRRRRDLPVLLAREQAQGEEQRIRIVLALEKVSRGQRRLEKQYSFEEDRAVLDAIRSACRRTRDALQRPLLDLPGAKPPASPPVD